MSKQLTRVVLGVLSLTFVAPPLHAQWDDLLKRGKEALVGSPDTTRKIAHFRLKGPLSETPTSIPPLFGGEPPLSLKTLLERFKDARLDRNVVAVVLDLQEAQLGPAQLEEIHDSLRKFKAVDKPVFVHADSLSMLTYTAATGASHISIVPTGDLWLVGIYGEAPYVRGMLDKIGVVPEFERFEDYKTAAEVLTNTEPSDASKEMTNWLLDSLYGSLVKRIADSRNLTPDKVKALIDDGPYTAEKAMKAGLIDSVKHRQDFVADLKKQFGPDTKIVLNYGREEEFAPPSDPFAIFTFLMEVLNPSPKRYTGPTVGVVYVEGPIMTGSEEPSLFGGSSGAFSTTIRRALDKAADEPNVRAVVLRVDSPGGSALASEIILDATKRVAKNKPLIVSMGNVAGSGGYYVACGSETIFAEPTTITASIGVVGGKLVTSQMWHKVGIDWHPNQRGRMAGIMSSERPWTEAERGKMRGYMEEIYGIFKTHVVANRGEKLTKPIEKVAGGRVFTGAQALEIGLVDRLGGLEDAVQFAAQKAGVSEYDIRVIPEPPSIFDLFVPKSGDEEYMDAGIRPLAFARHPVIAPIIETLAAVDPIRTRAVLTALTRLDLIRQEGVVTMMPFELVIR